MDPPPPAATKVQEIDSLATPYWVFLIPVVTAVIAILVGVIIARNSAVCAGPNLVLWTSLGLFILGPGLLVAITSVRLQRIKSVYNVVAHTQQQQPKAA